jgi:MGT family glycosyltransferase
MATILWLNWSGGGNLPPSLGIARVLTERGHQVAFAGRPEMVPRVVSAGFEAVQLKLAYAQAGLYPQGHPLTRAACYLTSPAVAAEVKSLVSDRAPDLVMVDGMFPAALTEAADFDIPAIVVCHTFCFRMLERWRNMVSMLNSMREQAGFVGLPGLDDLWLAREKIIVTTLSEFDTPAPAGWEDVRHVGPVLEDEKCAFPTSLPWRDDDPTPLVLVSFSTGFEQKSVTKLQNTLDALRDLPIHVVATTGGIVNPSELDAPDNAFVLNYAAHDPILRKASFVVTHGGHGTFMRTLKHGLPMIVIPGLAHDQAPNAALAQEWHAGIALPTDADADVIRGAAQKISSAPSYRQNAKRLAAALVGIDGAANAADEVETVLYARSRRRGEKFFASATGG